VGAQRVSGAVIFTRSLLAATLLAVGAASAQPLSAPDPAAVTRAAQAGDRNAQYRLGEMYDLGQGVAQDYGQAVAWYRRAAEQNFAPAQFALAEMYKNGDRVAKDMQQAIRWYRRASDNGSAPAQLLLGVLYESGTGVTADNAEAARWYRRSAEGGDARAQMMLANLYAMGQGVPRNPVVAYALYSESLRVDARDNPSRAHREKLARTMTPAQVQAARQLAGAMASGPLGPALDRARAEPATRAP
jgi:TPR repeat protein